MDTPAKAAAAAAGFADLAQAGATPASPVASEGLGSLFRRQQR